MQIKNWRPISLINVDIKIASKALAFGMKKVLLGVIYHDQTAYVEGRYVGESVSLLGKKIFMEPFLLQTQKRPLIQSIITSFSHS